MELKDMGVIPGPAAAKQLSRLTSLRHLKLDELDLDPSVLNHWKDLQSLVLDAVYLVAPKPQVVMVMF